MSDAYVALNDMTHSTDMIERGWWVVKAKYYYLTQRSPRGYVLQAQERVLVVNHLIRLPEPIVFAELRQTPRLQLRADANPLRILYDKDYYKIESSMQEV